MSGGVVAGATVAYLVTWLPVVVLRRRRAGYRPAWRREAYWMVNGWLVCTVAALIVAVAR